MPGGRRREDSCKVFLEEVCEETAADFEADVTLGRLRVHLLEGTACVLAFIFPYIHIQQLLPSHRSECKAFSAEESSLDHILAMIGVVCICAVYGSCTFPNIIIHSPEGRSWWPDNVFGLYRM